MLAGPCDDVEYERGNGSGPFGMREVELFRGFFFNPVVSIAAAATLWVFVATVSANNEQAMLDFKESQTWVTTTFTWLYIASQDYWLAFLVPLTYYYGHVKLGQDDEEPEYSDLSYFSMVFCAGVAIGLVFYGASEALWHMLSSGGSNRYNNNGYFNDNQAAQAGINVTLFHWGLQAWVVYALSAVSMGFLSYRKGLPLCFRTTLAPLFGKATWGWFGDLLDVITIVTIVSGLCTSLGLGAQQVVGGMQRLGMLDSDLSEDGMVNCRIIAIAVITGFATLSVVSGINYGIKTLSQTAFLLGNVLLCVVFYLDSPWYLLNLMVQSFGYHLQYFLEISFYTDAFAQLRVGQGAPNDGKGAASAWMNWWTIFYWGWWISWAPFVGTFLARISRGRTIRNVIAYSLTVPFLYSLVWFCTFGGAAIRMHRRANFLSSVGLQLFNNTDHFLHGSAVFRPAAAGKCYEVPASLPGPYAEKGAYVTDVHLSPVCAFSYQDDAGYWFDLMGQYYGMGPFLSLVSVITSVLFFVTSSDSGSLVVDLIAANGREAHVVQRVFWAISEGAVAIALLKAGGQQSLKALQAVSICAGLPFTFILMLMCTALWRALKIDQGHMAPRCQRTDWALPLFGGIFDIFETFLSFGRTGLPDMVALRNFLLGLLAPPVLLWHILSTLSMRQQGQAESKGKAALDADSSSWKDRAVTVSGCCALYVAFVLCIAVSFLVPGVDGFGFAAFIGFVTIVASCRHAVRSHYRIEGSAAEDLFSTFLLWPQVLAQLQAQVEIDPKALTPVICSPPHVRSILQELDEAAMDVELSNGGPTEARGSSKRAQEAQPLAREDAHPPPGASLGHQPTEFGKGRNAEPFEPLRPQAVSRRAAKTVCCGAFGPFATGV